MSLKQPIHTFNQAFYITTEDGNKLIFYGGSEFALPNRLEDPDLLIQADDLSSLNHCTPLLRVLSNPEARDFFPYKVVSAGFPHIIIDWPDMGVPLFNRIWWNMVCDRILGMDDGSKVYVCCTGATGRTGTILSIILGLLTEIENPVEFVRENYKNSAVETQGQIDYISTILGRPINSEPSSPLGYQWWQTYGSSYPRVEKDLEETVSMGPKLLEDKRGKDDQ